MKNDNLTALTMVYGGFVIVGIGALITKCYNEYQFNKTLQKIAEYGGHITINKGNGSK